LIRDGPEDWSDVPRPYSNKAKITRIAKATRYERADAQQNHSAIIAVITLRTSSTDPCRQVSQAFHVAHDARDQGAVLLCRGRHDKRPMCLHLLAQVGDHALRGLGKKLCSANEVMLGRTWRGREPKQE